MALPVCPGLQPPVYNYSIIYLQHVTLVNIIIWQNCSCLVLLELKLNMQHHKCACMEFQCWQNYQIQIAIWSILLQMHGQTKRHCQFCCKYMGNLQSMIKMWHECMVKLKCECIILSSQSIGKCECIVSNECNTLSNANAWSVWSTEYQRVKYLWPSLVSPVSTV